jgi:hypothetical protein
MISLPVGLSSESTAPGLLVKVPLMAIVLPPPRPSGPSYNYTQLANGTLTEMITPTR